MDISLDGARMPDEYLFRMAKERTLLAIVRSHFKSNSSIACKWYSSVFKIRILFYYTVHLFSIYYSQSYLMCAKMLWFVYKWRLTTRLAFGIGASIVTANDELPYVAVYMSSIHNHKLSIYTLSKSEFLSINQWIKRYMSQARSFPVTGECMYERLSGLSR